MRGIGRDARRENRIHQRAAVSGCEGIDQITHTRRTVSRPIGGRGNGGDLFGQRITPRETQVVAQVLEGHSSDSIAKNLAISVGTVRIHRRNIYAKLQISSQQELFSIFLKRITAERGQT